MGSSGRRKPARAAGGWRATTPAMTTARRASVRSGENASHSRMAAASSAVGASAAAGDRRSAVVTSSVASAATTRPATSSVELASATPASSASGTLVAPGWVRNRIRLVKVPSQDQSASQHRGRRRMGGGGQVVGNERAIGREIRHRPRHADQLSEPQAGLIERLPDRADTEPERARGEGDGPAILLA